jgi:hypothetical protein
MADTGGGWFAVVDVPVGSCGCNLAEDLFEGCEGNGVWKAPLRFIPKGENGELIVCE